jgi:hypothetical protein
VKSNRFLELGSQTRDSVSSIAVNGCHGWTRELNVVQLDVPCFVGFYVQAVTGQDLFDAFNDGEWRFD